MHLSLALYSLSVLPLRLSPLTNTSTITVSSCSVKLQEVLSGLDKTLDIHMHFCGFSQHSFITLFFFHSWGVIFFDFCVTACGLPSLADNSKYVFLRPVLKVMYIVNFCLANPDNKPCSEPFNNLQH